MARRATLRDLLAAGLLEAGEELVCEPRQGEVYKATLREDGLVSYEGTTFDSPSRWASHVGQNARNGWRDVKARGQPLGHFREELHGGSRSGGLTSVAAVAQRREASPEPSPQPGPSLPPVQAEGRKGDGLVVPSHVHSLEEILEAQRSKLRADLLAWMKQLSPSEFQRFCKYVLEALGCSDVKVGPPGPDGGVDGDARRRSGVVETLVLFQAKRWQHSVGRPEVDKFRGAIQGKCHEGVLLTTSDFTADAQQAAVQMGAVPIHLINGQRIVDLMVEKKIGVRDYPVIVLQRDPTFLA